MKRGGRLPVMSDKRKAEQRLRKKMTDERFEIQPWCAYCGKPYERDYLHLHEIKSAAQGGSRTDPDNTVLVCDFCNSAFESTERAAAIAAGFKVTRKDGAA